MQPILRIGNWRISAEQILAAIPGYGLLDPILRGIILDAAIKDISLSNEEMLRAIASSEIVSDDQTTTFLKRWCEENNITADQLHWNYLRPARIEKFKQINFAPAVETEFQRRKLEFDRIEYSLIRVQDGYLAHELYLMLRDDQAEFDQIAYQYSQGPEKETGGYLGVVPFSTVPVQLLDAMRIAQPRKILKPIQIEDWSYLIRLERIFPAILTDTMRSHLLNQMFADWLQTYVNTVLSTPNAIAIETIP